MRINIKKKNLAKVLALALELFAVGLIIYLIALPFYPKIVYKLEYSEPASRSEAQSVEKTKQKVAEFKNSFPKAEYAVSPNRLIIPKIGVNAPIVESQSADYGLSKGSWRVPESSTPDKGGNTVITGHRFKYLPPNNLTFYLLDKLKKGDIISIIWKKQDYFYRVKETKVVPNTELSIMDQTKEPILTLFTCDPIYSTKNRLVVIADLVQSGGRERGE